MAAHHDLLVIGGGPAGYAAAITAAGSDARVCLIDRALQPGYRPGETLHPGVEPLFDRLGVGPEIRKRRFVRFDGIRVQSEDGGRFEPFGTDENGRWSGFQVPGEELDAILRERAEALGVDIRVGEAARSPLFENGRVSGVRTTRGTVRANFTADCTGGRHWLARHLSIPIQRLSPPLIAQFGYARGDASELPETPVFETDRKGWTWSAKISHGVLHWTRLNLYGRPPAKNWRPGRWRELAPVGRVRRSNVTWRKCETVSGNGFFLCGDAAMVLDPSSSHGVLKALMSGMLAGNHAAASRQDPRLEEEAHANFQACLNGWFDADTEHMKLYYAKLANPPPWAAP